jgi:hypothetical protein
MLGRYTIGADGRKRKKERQKNGKEDYSLFFFPIKGWCDG